MLHHIKKLHAHPEHVRERVALGAALAITFSIFAAWAFTLDSRLAILDFDNAAKNTAAAGESGLTVANMRAIEPGSPTAILKKKLGETYGDLKEAVGY